MCVFVCVCVCVCGLGGGGGGGREGVRKSCGGWATSSKLTSVTCFREASTSRVTFRSNEVNSLAVNTRDTECVLLHVHSVFSYTKRQVVK